MVNGPGRAEGTNELEVEYDKPCWSRMVEVEPDLADRYRAAMTRALNAALDVDELAAVLQQATDDGADRTEDYALAVVAHLTKGNENDE